MAVVTSSIDRVRAGALFRVAGHPAESSAAGRRGMPGLPGRRLPAAISPHQLDGSGLPRQRHGLEIWLDGYEDTSQRGRLSSGCQRGPHCLVWRSPGAVRPCLLSEVLQVQSLHSGAQSGFWNPPFLFWDLLP